MTPDEYDARWVCAVCGRPRVVPSLARDCEARHEAEEHDEDVEEGGGR